MNRFVIAAASAATITFVPCMAQAQAQAQAQAPAQAQVMSHPDQPMSHQEKVTFAQWTQRVQKAMMHELHYPHAMLGAEPATGLVRVKFNCSDSGRPDKVTISKSSGSPQLDRAALRAVGRIASLHPLPDAFAHGQAYQAMILFGSDAGDDWQGRQKNMMRDAAKLNTRFADPAIASVGIAPAAGGGS